MIYVQFICSKCGKKDSGKQGTYKVEKKLCTSCCIEEAQAKKINVLPHTFEQDGREELFLLFPSKVDAEMVKEFLENKTIKMMWIEPQNSFGSHALRIEAVGK